MKYLVVADEVDSIGRLSESEKVRFSSENRDFGLVLSSNEKN